MALETRTLVRPLSLRAEGDQQRVGGYACVYNSHADIGDSFKEVFAVGAFDEAVRGDVVALFGHDRNRVLGRTAAGTLRLTSDATGVAFEIDLPDTSDGRDLAVSVDRGDIRGSSFGFRAVKETWDETGPVPVRIIQVAELREISPTAFPAYPDTSIALRSLAEAQKDRRAENHTQAARRLRMKVSLDLRSRR